MKFRVLVAWEDVTSRQVKRRAARGFWCSRTGVPCFAACWELVHMTGRSRENRAALTAVALWTDILNVSESNLFLRETQTEVC